VAKNRRVNEVEPLGIDSVIVLKRFSNHVARILNRKDSRNTIVFTVVQKHFSV
jgi:hypothetical protein